MRIDAHQHFWRYEPEDYPWIGARMGTLKCDYLPQDLAPVLRQHQIEASVCVQARQDMTETQWLLNLANRHAWIAGVVGWADLADPALERQLTSWRTQLKLRGFRHQVQDEANAESFLARPDFNRGVALLQRHRYVYDVLILSSQLDAAVTFCARHDQHWLVLDHLAKPAVRQHEFDDWAARLGQFRSMPHVACKLSGLITEADWRAWTPGALGPYLETALEIFGPERVMFGSDWPVCLLAGDYADVHALAEGVAGKLTASEREAFWGGNAAKCYGLN